MLLWKGVPGTTGALVVPGKWVNVPTAGTTAIVRYHGLVHTSSVFIE